MLANLKTLLAENDRRGNPITVFLGIKPTDEPIQAVIEHPDFVLINSLVNQDLVASLNDQAFYVDDWIGAVTLPAYLRKRPLVPRAFRPCRLLYAGLMLYSNGKVGACACRDFDASSELILGNVGEQSLDAMWNGATLAGLRSRWLGRSQGPDICKTCRHYLY